MRREAFKERRSPDRRLFGSAAWKSPLLGLYSAMLNVATWIRPKDENGFVALSRPIPTCGSGTR